MARIIARIKQSTTVIMTVFFVGISSNALASSDKNIDPLQRQLIDLRSTVDAKSEELSLLRQENRQRRKFMLSQITELEATLEHKQLMISKIDHKLEKNREQLAATKQTDQLSNELELAIDELSLYISKSLPFKRNARLEALDEIRQQLVSKSVTAPRLANKLWAFVEDELMLTKGNGIYRQIIKLNNEEKLVDVARVGMMMLYYRDGAGNVGMATKSANQRQKNEGWKFVALNQKEQIHQVHYLFDSFQKQVRFGEFTLPNALSGPVVQRNDDRGNSSEKNHEGSEKSNGVNKNESFN
ncbi:MAG: DUF3450 domain-containing protein [Gammaproteobacteria bacterium]|nr:DUF3450 domain-containing protein [Gammaproteobacteria bacterium]